MVTHPCINWAHDCLTSVIKHKTFAPCYVSPLCTLFRDNFPGAKFSSPSKKEEKFQFILTGRLNQDCVENLFSITRGKGGKTPVDTYQDCSNQLILPKLLSPYDELSVYEFLQNKTYQEAGCQVYPTPAMITFVDRLETLFSGIFEGIIHMPHVLARLCKCEDDFCTFWNGSSWNVLRDWKVWWSCTWKYEYIMLWKDPMYK